MLPTNAATLLVSGQDVEYQELTLPNTKQTGWHTCVLAENHVRRCAFERKAQTYGHFFAHKAGIGAGALAKATTNLLHSVLDFLHCHAGLNIAPVQSL